MPAYSLNGGPLIAGTWPGGYSYNFGPTVNLSSGFVAGQNVIEFYVEGNGVTDGLAVNPISFTAGVPEPASLDTGRHRCRLWPRLLRLAAAEPCKGWGTGSNG